MECGVRVEEENKKLKGWRITVRPKGEVCGTVIRLESGRSGFECWQGQDLFLSSRTSKSTLGPTQPHI